jgi:uncharacterized membrane protein YvbJ
MKYCENCGQEVKKTQDVCLSCGKKLPKADDHSSFGFALLGFFIPVVGLILYLIWKDDYPKKSLSAGKGALVSFLLSIFFFFLGFTPLLFL